MGEAHAPGEVVRDLNAYFTLMEGAIRLHGGLVLQYIGDEIEAVFGAPVAEPRHAMRAVQAALEMRQRLEAWNVEREAMGRPVFRHGIGIHTGPVLAAAIGSPDRLSYALVGDAVNLASRLQAAHQGDQGRHRRERRDPAPARRRGRDACLSGRARERQVDRSGGVPGALIWPMGGMSEMARVTFTLDEETVVTKLSDEDPPPPPAVARWSRNYHDPVIRR